SVNLDAFIRFRSCPSQGSVAENSSFALSSSQGAEHDFWGYAARISSLIFSANSAGGMFPRPECGRWWL
ncbi:hypothetical protein, partial [Wenxinia marina]|uniref:hypothetical protein n=1 Tax=Wenxinia marina TaxID=390641 RepID=UPI001E38717C